MNKLPFLLRSRTFWTLVVLVLMNILPQVKDYVPADLLDAFTGILGVIAAFYHINPSQTYATPPQIALQSNPLVKCPLDPPKGSPKA